MRSIRTYLDIMRKKGVYTCLRETKKAVWPVWWTHSRAAIEQIQAERTSRYLWCEYGSMISKPLEATQDIKRNKQIWICWLQGRNNAPEIVKKCIDSVERYGDGYEVLVLSAETVFDFVSLPEQIIRKYQSGKIAFTHFSDILRTALLVQHGGIWIDSTVLLTDSIPEVISEQPLFFFQRSVLQSAPHFGSNWFLAANKGNPVMKRMLELLIAYWTGECVLRDYYIYHIFMYLLLVRNTQAADMLRTMPYIPNVDAHTLQYRLFEDFNEQQWNHICSRSAIHKLTWKFNHNEPTEKSGTYYDHILHHLHV